MLKNKYTELARQHQDEWVFFGEDEILLAGTYINKGQERLWTIARTHSEYVMTYGLEPDFKCSEFEGVIEHRNALCYPTIDEAVEDLYDCTGVKLNEEDYDEPSWKYRFNWENDPYWGA